MDTQAPAFVILGATGDLTSRMLFPAIYQLFAQGDWNSSKIVGYGLDDWTAGQFQSHLETSLQELVPGFDAKVWAKLVPQIAYQRGDLTPSSLGMLKSWVDGPAIFYLALPPQLFGEAAGSLGKAGWADETKGWRRLVVEKPFGEDLASAQYLNGQISSAWQESQIFRIDHFLGKDTAQNILVFRWINLLLAAVWNRDYISQVQITYAETLGLEGRWSYYDKAGALRDMLQNHLLQLLALTAMEPMTAWDVEDLHHHRSEVLRSIVPIPPDEVPNYAVRGQYTAGSKAGQPVVGYRQEPHIAPTSDTETFAAVKCLINTWRWQGVPFYLRSGKRLAADYAEIAVQFKAVPPGFFGAGQNNWVVFQLKPQESIILTMAAKTPGWALGIEEMKLAGPYKKGPEEEYTPYEHLLYDVLTGDHSAFPQFDEVEAAWRVMDPVLTAWKTGEPEFYAAGSQGPAAADKLMDLGQQWRIVE